MKKYEDDVLWIENRMNITFSDDSVEHISDIESENDLLNISLETIDALKNLFEDDLLPSQLGK